MEEQALLRTWVEEEGCLIPAARWESWILVSNHTLEHEVRYRPDDQRAVKRTWPGTFGFIPDWNGTSWVPRAASPAEYLHRMHLQNEIFLDQIRLEGGMIGSGPSLVIGSPAGGFSFVISQPWLVAADNSRQFPSEDEIDARLRELGFTPLARTLYGWQNSADSIILLDAKPDNFITTPAGIFPIDLLLAECLPANHGHPAAN